MQCSLFIQKTVIQCEAAEKLLANLLEKYTLQSIYQTCKERHIKREHNNSTRKPKPSEIVKAIVENELLLILKNGMARIFST